MKVILQVILSALLLSNLTLPVPVVPSPDDVAPEFPDDHPQFLLQYHAYKNTIVSQFLPEHSYLSTFCTRMPPITEKDVVDLLQQLQLKHEEQSQKPNED